MRWLAVATVVLAALVATGAARAPAQEESDCMTDPLGPVRRTASSRSAIST